MNIEKHVEECIKTAIELGKYSYEIIIQPKITNKLYKQSYRNFMKLKALGDGGIEQIENMMEHEIDYVKSIAAVHLLPYRTDKALITLHFLLKKYQNQKGLYGFNINMVIEEWNRGNLREYYTVK